MAQVFEQEAHLLVKRFPDVKWSVLERFDEALRLVERHRERFGFRWLARFLRFPSSDSINSPADENGP